MVGWCWLVCFSLGWFNHRLQSCYRLINWQVDTQLDEVISRNQPTTCGDSSNVSPIEMGNHGFWGMPPINQPGVYWSGLALRNTNRIATTSDHRCAWVILSWWWISWCWLSGQCWDYHSERPPDIPLSGKLKEVSGSYIWSFYVFIVVAFLACCHYAALELGKRRTLQAGRALVGRGVKEVDLPTQEATCNKNWCVTVHMWGVQVRLSWRKDLS